MAIRFSTTALALAALTLTAANAEAQRRPTSTRRIPVQKGESPVTPRVDTVYQTRVDTVYRTTRDTVTMTRFDTVTNTVSVPMTFHRVGGPYFGLGAGMNPTVGHLDNTAASGWAGVAMIGWDQANGPLGLRIDVTENQFVSNDRAIYAAGFPRTGNPEILTVGADLKLNLPINPTTLNNVKLYGLGGVTWNSYRNVPQLGGPGSNVVGTTDRTNRWGWQAGGGMQFGIGSRSAIFLEGRYVRFTADNNRGFGNWAYIPLTVGFNWF